MSHLEKEQTLNRGLKNRHVQLIAIGGAIGTGLFLGSGHSIALTGPAILFAYIITGIICFLYDASPWRVTLIKHGVSYFY